MRETETRGKGSIILISPGSAARHPVKGNNRTLLDCNPQIGTTDLLLGGMIKAATPSSRKNGGWFVEAGDPEPGVGYSGFGKNITALMRNS